MLCSLCPQLSKYTVVSSWTAGVKCDKGTEQAGLTLLRAALSTSKSRRGDRKTNKHGLCTDRRQTGRVTVPKWQIIVAWQTKHKAHFSDRQTQCNFSQVKTDRPQWQIKHCYVPNRDLVHSTGTEKALPWQTGHCMYTEHSFKHTKHCSNCHAEYKRLTVFSAETT